MGLGMQNDWNQGFSSDFLSLPQPQGAGNSGAYQFAFSNQQDFGSQPGFTGTPQYGGQQYGNQQAFDGQQFGSQAGYGDMAGFENQQNFEGQQFNSMSESSFGSSNQAAFPGSNQMPDVAQQNVGSQQGQSMTANLRWRNPQQSQPSPGQDQMPFPNNGYTGQ